MKLKAIIVTGCGGDIGISIGRLLKHEELATRIIGVDIKKYHSGSVFFDEVYQIPLVGDKNYSEALTKIVDAADADFIIPITDMELAFFAENNIQMIGNARVVMPNGQAIVTGLDKLKTFDILSAAKIPMPHTQLVGSTTQPMVPCIIKKRFGHGGKDIAIITSEEDFIYHRRKREQDICQEYLPDENAEYTCGLFRSRDKEIRTFVLRRRLLGGLTGEGVVESNKAIESTLIAVANVLNLHGSINVQLRLSVCGPRIFEINPRFSSTVYFRHLLGFKDVIWSLYDKLQIKLPPYIPPLVGTRIYRTFGELVLPPIEA